MAQKRKAPAKRSTGKKKGFFDKKAGNVAKLAAWEPGTKTKAGSTRKTVAKRIGTSAVGLAAGTVAGTATKAAARKAGAKGKGGTAAAVTVGGAVGRYAIGKTTRNKTRKYRTYSGTPVGKARKAVGKFEDKALAKGAKGIKKGVKAVRGSSAGKSATRGLNKGKTGFTTYKRKLKNGKTISVKRSATAKRSPAKRARRK